MEIDILIDKLTPCLERVSTGEMLPTVFSLAKDKELIGLQKKGWNFNWADDELKSMNIYKLTLKNDKVIQGLVAAQIGRGVVYAALAESAPHNLGKSKQYKGVGGHLFAIAVKKSMDLGYDGFVYMDAKNLKLVEHYRETLGAEFIGMPHQYRMAISEKTAKKLLQKYTLQED